jgi:hypothetical protein
MTNTRCTHPVDSCTYAVVRGTDPETGKRQLRAKRVCRACKTTRVIDVTPDAARWGFTPEQWAAWWSHPNVA